jgi:hypothetical protein
MKQKCAYLLKYVSHTRDHYKLEFSLHLADHKLVIQPVSSSQDKKSSCTSCQKFA